MPGCSRSRFTSTGKYMRLCPQTGQRTATGWAGTPWVPDGMLQEHPLQRTTEVLRDGMAGMKPSIGE
jgi:hypothetical protein